MRATLLLSLLLLAGCVGAEDNPTSVHDLRVLAVQLEPPEVLMEGCNVQLLLSALGQSADGGAIEVPPELEQLVLRYASTPIRYTALVADPAGQGRELSYRVRACASRSDRQCDDDGQFVQLLSGSAPAGEISGSIRPGLQFLEDGSPLLFEVIELDTFKGLGGIRVPIVLDISAPGTEERVVAQKLMVYTCQFFPSMKQNVTPVLPGVTWNGEAWAEDDVKLVTTRDDVVFEPVPFQERQEPYVVPSLMLSPVSLTESWKVSWLTTNGTMSASNTGGTDFVGEEGRHRSVWSPSISSLPEDVTFYFVVRDGRGGQSWLTRRARFEPK